MANTVHGPYSPTAWTGSTGISTTQLDRMETGPAVALASLNPDLITAGFVLSGVACAKDATTATQLDVTAGHAYLIMTDGTLARIDVAATTFSAVGNPTATLYLDLNPDGTWSWATTHSAVSNHLTICTVTTDGSSNISGVTDTRVKQPKLLAGAKSGPAIAAPLAALITQSPLLAGTVVGGVTFGQASSLPNSMATTASFNGSTGYITLPTTSLPTGNAAFTLSGRFKTSVTATNQFIASMGAGATKEAALLYINTSNHLVGDLYNSSIASTSTFTDGLWHEAVFTWDGTNGNLYCDGTLVAGPTALGPNNLTLSGGAGIGYQSSITSNLFNGSLAHVAIFGSALSAANVTALHNAATSITSDAYASTLLGLAPLRYYPLADVAGSSVAADTISATPSTVVDAGGVFGGALLIDSEGSNTVARSIPTSNPLIFQVNGMNTKLDAAGGLTVPGAVASIGGQASVGSFGAPVIVAQAIHTHVTSTTQQTLISTTLPAGIYRISGSFTMNNGTSPQLISFQWGYVTRTFGALNPAGSLTVFTSATAFASLNGSSASVSNNDWIIVPQVFDQAASGTVTVTYHDPGGTPSDYVSAIIERLA